MTKKKPSSTFGANLEGLGLLLSIKHLQPNNLKCDIFGLLPVISSYEVLFEILCIQRRLMACEGNM
jgi:hypothetical protein